MIFLGGMLLGIACGNSPTNPIDELNPADLNILFIGNSLTYTNDLPGMLRALLDSAGVGPVVVASSALPNFGLEDHWNYPPTRDLLGRPERDYVILQQGPSATEGRPSLLEFGKIFAEEIRRSGGEPAFYMVWPSNQRFFDFDGVRDSYRMAADSADAQLFPAGEAWRVAWETDADLGLYGSDEFHPSVQGTYLAALVMFEHVAVRSSVGLPNGLDTPEGGRVNIPAGIATDLQRAATEANNRFSVSINPGGGHPRVRPG